MKIITLIGVKTFFFFAIFSMVVFGTTFTIYSRELATPFKYATMVGLFTGFCGALLVIFERVIFKKKLFSYSKIDAELESRGIKNIIFEENAMNAAVIRTQLGGLFLSDEAVLFVPGRFAFRPRFIILPLQKINRVGKARTNPLKFFFDVLRRRLAIETIEGERYEFLVWELNKWIEEIRKAKDQAGNHR